MLRNVYINSGSFYHFQYYKENCFINLVCTPIYQNKMHLKNRNQLPKCIRKHDLKNLF